MEREEEGDRGKRGGGGSRWRERMLKMWVLHEVGSSYEGL